MPDKPKPGRDNGKRLLTLAELAKYLHLGQRTVLNLVKKKQLPGVLIDNQWRFKRAAVDSWLDDQMKQGDQDFEEIPDGMRVPLGDLLPDDAIIGDLHAKDALSVIEELAARAYSNRWLADKPWFVGQVVERETLASTAMEGGVAFLHTRQRDTRKIARPFVVMGRSYNGIDFGAPDGKLTHLFFLLGLKYDALHLPILGRLARAMRNPALIAKLRSISSEHEIRALLLKEDADALASTKGKRIEYESTKPKLDRQVRLRAIMRLNAIRKHEEKKSREEPAKKAAAKKKAEAKKAAAKKKAEAKKAAAKKKAEAKKAKPAGGKATKTKTAKTKAAKTKTAKTKAAKTKAAKTKAAKTKAAKTKATKTKATKKASTGKSTARKRQRAGKKS